MQDGESFLCSQLLRVFAGRAVRTGNLEDICSERCTVLVEELPPIGTRVTIRCIECPNGKKSCTDCRFKGRVRCHQEDPVLGGLMQVEFEGRSWSPEEWHPQHLIPLRDLEEIDDG